MDLSYQLNPQERSGPRRLHCAGCLRSRTCLAGGTGAAGAGRGHRGRGSGSEALAGLKDLKSCVSDVLKNAKVHDIACTFGDACKSCGAAFLHRPLLRDPGAALPFAAESAKLPSLNATQALCSSTAGRCKVPYQLGHASVKKRRSE